MRGTFNQRRGCSSGLQSSGPVRSGGHCLDSSSPRKQSRSISFNEGPAKPCTVASPVLCLLTAAELLPSSVRRHLIVQAERQLCFL